MARNEEKQLARLNRWYLQQQRDEEAIKRPPRPKLDSLNSAEDVKKWIPSIRRDIDFYVKQMEVPCYPEHVISEFDHRIDCLKGEYKAFLRKLRQLCPEEKSTPWTDRPYSVKRKKLPDASKEDVDQNCATSNLRSAVDIQTPPNFVPLNTPILNSTEESSDFYAYTTPVILTSLCNLDDQSQNQPLQLLPVPKQNQTKGNSNMLNTVYCVPIPSEIDSKERESSLLEHSTSKPMEHVISKPMEHSTSKSMEHGTSKPMEHSTSKPMEHGISKPLEHSTSKSMEHSTSKSMEHSTSKPMEHSNSKPMEHSNSTSKSVVHNTSKRMEHITSKSVEHSTSKSVVHSTSKSMEHSKLMKHSPSSTSKPMEYSPSSTSNPMEHSPSSTSNPMEHSPCSTSNPMEHSTNKPMKHGTTNTMKSLSESRDGQSSNMQDSSCLNFDLLKGKNSSSGGQILHSVFSLNLPYSDSSSEDSDEIT